MSAAEHAATRHNTTAATRRLALQLPNNLARAPMVFVRWDGHVPPLQPLYDGPYTVICSSLHHFTLCIGDKEDKVSTLKLKPCTDCTARSAQGSGPHRSQQNRAGNRFPLACSQGFLHAPPPFSTTPPLGPPATAERRPD